MDDIRRDGQRQCRRHHEAHVHEERDQTPDQAGMGHRRRIRLTHGQEPVECQRAPVPGQRARRVPHQIIHVEQAIRAREHAQRSRQLHRLHQQRDQEPGDGGRGKPAMEHTPDDEPERQKEHDVHHDLQHSIQPVGTYVGDEPEQVQLRLQMVDGAERDGIGRQRVQSEAQQADCIQHRAIRGQDRRQSKPVIAVIQHRQHRNGQRHGHHRPQRQRKQERNRKRR